MKNAIIEKLITYPAKQFEFGTFEETYEGGFKLTLPKVYPTRMFGKTTGKLYNEYYDYLMNKYNIPDEVVFNEKKGATTLLYHSQERMDETNVTVVKTCKGDKFDKRYGFLLAYFQHNSGLSKTQSNKYLKELLIDE